MGRYDELKQVVDLYSKSFDKRIVFGEVLSRIRLHIGEVDFYLKEDIFLDLGIPVKVLDKLSPFDIRRHLFKGYVSPGDHLYLCGSTYIALCSSRGDYYGLIEVGGELVLEDLDRLLAWLGVVSFSLEDMHMRGKWESEISIYHKLHKLGIDLGDLNRISKAEEYLKGFIGEEDGIRKVEVVLEVEGIGECGGNRKSDLFVNGLMDRGKVCKLYEEELHVLGKGYRSGIAFLIKDEEKLMGYILVLSKEIEVMDRVEVKMWSAVLSYLELLVSNLSLLESLRREKMKDGLTGLYVRGYLEEKVRDKLENSLGGSLLLLDIDDFKMLNDTYGHLVGDEVLIKVSSILEDNVRKGDIVSRWGGEEFVIFLPELALEESLVISRRLLSQIRNNTHPRATVSGGLVNWSSGDDMSYKEIFKKADGLLYKAKGNGKNRVEYG